MRKAKLVLGAVAASCLLIQPVMADTSTVAIDTDKSFISWLGEKVAGQHNGILRLKSGSVSMNGDDITGGNFVIDMSTISNKDIKSAGDRAKLEGHLKSPDFFNVQKFPEGTFKIKNVSKNASTGNHDISGELTVKGITLPVSFPAKISENAEQLVGEGNLTIDRSKWDIRYNSKSFFDVKKLGDKLIYDDIKIGVKIVANKSNS